jgi:hypothetical protein
MRRSTVLARKFPWLIQVVFGLASLVSGAALLLSVIFKLSLAVTLGALGAFVAASCGIVWRSASVSRRRELKALARAGAIGGLSGTLAYDAIRVVIVRVGRLRVRPFKALPIFGTLLVGTRQSLAITLAAGISYHCLNGIMFGCAYSFFFGGRGWKYGVMWALGLEAMMLALYPGWLHIDALLREFTLVSMSGHLMYGSVLGAVDRRLLESA